MATDPSFEVQLTADETPHETLLVGLADVGLAGLTAVDYLVSHEAFEQIGHVRTRGLPDVAPFSNGEPRHPIRIYNARDSDLTVFVSEVFLPVTVADLVADGLLEWAATTPIESVAVVHGAPFPHDESGHEAFHVATEAFREANLAGTDIQPLPGGFFDGVVGELVVRGLEAEGIPTGVLVTPAHPPGPDFDGAVLLLEAVEAALGVSIDTEELQKRSEELKRYYQELSDRLQTLQESERALGGRDFPEDRMYM